MKYCILNDFVRLEKALLTNIVLCPTEGKRVRLQTDLVSETYLFIVVVTIKIFTYYFSLDNSSNQFCSS